jgi:hypothetical protein
MRLAARRFDRSWCAAALVLGALVPIPARAVPTLGFREDFTSTVGEWTAGLSITDPGSGGVGGAGDGYLLASRVTAGQLGVHSFGAEYIGDWSAAGITQIRLWVRDVGATGDLQLHLGIGNDTNFWLYVPAVLPDALTWREYVVHLDQPADWVPIIGTGTFADALAGADRILIRHDFAPYAQNPKAVIGAFGLDHILLTDGVTGVVPEAPDGGTLELAAPYPDPARGRVTFRLRAPADAPATLRVVDVSGRELRRVELAAGGDERVWTWDGTDARGARVPSGVYRVSVGAAGAPVRRFVWLR